MSRTSTHRQLRLLAAVASLLLAASLIRALQYVYFDGGEDADPALDDTPLAHHLEATDPALRACPAWRSILPGAWEAKDVKPGQGEVLFGTAQAQQIIYQHQHPADCENARFLVHKSQGSGIGSLLHQMGVALAGALDLGRVLIFDKPDPNVYLSDQYCEGARSWDECYFFPISNCSAKVTIPDWMPMNNYSDPSLADQKFTFDETGLTNPQYVVPRAFNQLLDGSNVPVARRYYWYRSQAAAYVVRLNDRTVAKLQEIRAERFTETPSLNHAISVHIRRGDKWREAEPVSDRAYSLAAENMHKLLEVSGRYPTPEKKAVFVSTEDAAALDYFVNQTDWDVHWVKDPVMLKSNSTLWSIDYAALIGPSRDMLGSLLNLQLAMECSAWVGTLSSNWCRLIDQMRSTVGCKAHLPYSDPAQPDQTDYKFWH
mmetsp:Transcript_20255/g.61032  ORF Transcript_20255/g.61032 Transcript_20255/m.61032 type:complete len:429 (-) Transcript_20255:963-2249(-)